MSKATSETIPVDAIRSRIQEVDDERRELADKDRELRIERDVLVKLLNRAPGMTLRRAHSSTADRPKPTEAVIDFLRENPGATRRQVMDRLHDTIESRAENKRRLLYMTITNLIKSGKIVQDGDALRIARSAT